MAISASVQVVDLTASTTYAIPVASLDYIELVASVEVDDRGKYKIFISSAAVVDSTVWTMAKALSDGVAAVENLAYDFATSRFDVANTLDYSNYSFAKQTSDTVGTADYLGPIDTGKAVFEYAVTDDSTAASVQKLIYDGVSINDLVGIPDGITFSYSKTVANIASASDSSTKTFETSRFETVSVTDSYGVSYDKPVQETVSISEYTAYGFTRGTTEEQVFVADSQIIYTNRGLQDSVGSADSGVLVMQDYCDLSYFLQDYVGFSRSF